MRRGEENQRQGGIKSKAAQLYTPLHFFMYLYFSFSFIEPIGGTRLKGALKQTRNTNHTVWIITRFTLFSSKAPETPFTFTLIYNHRLECPLDTQNLFLKVKFSLIEWVGRKAIGFDAPPPYPHHLLPLSGSTTGETNLDFYQDDNVSISFNEFYLTVFLNASVCFACHF